MARVARRSSHPVLIVVIGLFFGTWCADIAYDEWKWDRALREHGQLATGHIVEVTHGRGGRIRVEYPVSGWQKVEATLEGGTATRVHVGDELPIRYDPSRPTGLVYDDRVNDQYHDVWLLTALAAIILIGTPLAAWFAFRSRRRAAAQYEGDDGG